MAGHSKWSSIKHKKAATDAKRSKIFTRILKEIAVAARLGGGDPSGNPRLRTAIQEAKSNNVPNDNIDRAIKKGTGELEGASYEELSYEGYGPKGVAVMVETMTDNKNRTVSEIRHLFSKFGGNLGENGCVAWMFEQRGVFVIDPETMDEEPFVELAIELEAEDFAVEEDGYQLLVSPTSYLAVREELAEQLGDALLVKELAMVPKNQVDVAEGDSDTVVRLLEALEEQDDVQNVWANAKFADSVAVDLTT